MSKRDGTVIITHSFSLPPGKVGVTLEKLRWHLGVACFTQYPNARYNNWLLQKGC